MKALITGGAGCIGSVLASKLLGYGHSMLVFDNLSSGKEEHIQKLLKDKNFEFVNGDLLKPEQIKSACKGVEVVFHLAANSDVKYKPGNPTDEDLKLNIVGTYNVLEAMRVNDVKKIVFTSSSVVYGEAKKTPTPENYPLEPISLYAASKIADEALISGFCHMFGMQAWIVRLANIIGNKTRRVGKTVISDFIDKLGKNPKELEILGDGKQKKSYLLVDDCIEGIMTVFSKSNDKINTYNLGPEDSVTVNKIAEIVVNEMKLKNVKFEYTGGDRGWLGDVPTFLLDTNKIRSLGWKPKHTSEEAIRIAAKSLLRVDR